MLITEAKKAHLLVYKRIGFVGQMLGDFVKMTLTCVSSHCFLLGSRHVVKTVTRVESPSFFNVTRVGSAKIVIVVESFSNPVVLPRTPL